MRLLSIILLIVFIAVGCLTNLIKKFGMDKHLDIGLTEYGKWFGVATNPVVMSTLFIGVINWGITLWLFSLERGTTAISWIFGSTILVNLFSIALISYIFKEVLTHTQLVGVGILVVAGSLSVVGMYLLGVGEMVVSV